MIFLASHRYGGPSALASEYLNQKFGILPTVADIQGLARALINFNNELRQFQRDAGRNVRRKRNLVEDTVVNETTIGPGAIDLPSIQWPYEIKFFQDPLPPLKMTEVIRSRSWFSGAFSYYLDSSHTGYLGRMGVYEAKANHLLGTRLNVATIWELTPWTWLIDWFLDISTFVKNAELIADDSVVLRYGYVMHETVASREYSIAGIKPSDPSGSVPTRVSVILEYTRKLRKRASPYGFGVDLSNMSPSKWAILTALGMTKAPGVLVRGSS